MPHTKPVLLAIIAFSALSAPTAKAAQEYCPPSNAPRADLNPGAGPALRAPVHPNAVGTLTCVINGLKNIGLPIKTLWGYGCRPLSTSNHPRGLAVDVNQSARNKTNPAVPVSQGISIANSCNATSGAQWHDADNGHFEVRSLSRSQQIAQRPSSAPQYPHYKSFLDLILSWFGLA